MGRRNDIRNVGVWRIELSRLDDGDFRVDATIFRVQGRYSPFWNYVDKSAIKVF
jgi:hypothetical protein